MPPLAEGYLLSCTLLQALLVFYGLWNGTSCPRVALVAPARPPLAVPQGMVALCAGISGASPKSLRWAVLCCTSMIQHL